MGSFFPAIPNIPQVIKLSHLGIYFFRIAVVVDTQMVLSGEMVTEETGATR